ncbi:MAG TPA: hypothetical protein VG651_14100 [Stellaceae bacterium]|nr:hypothetical protein [Stellaceae bacterium]
MERNRWETAIRCLEIAVHPNTSDEEALAAIRGFRRTARNAAVSQFGQTFAGGVPAHLLDRLDQLNQENRELRRRIAETEADRTDMRSRLQQAEHQTREIGRALLAAEQRADTAERRLAESQGTYGPAHSPAADGGRRGENLDLRRAFDEARRNLAQPIHEPVAPFRTMLDAAMRGAEQTRPAPVAGARQPWTA